MTKLKPVLVDDFPPRFLRAAKIATDYALDELGWARADVEAAVEDTLNDHTFLVRLRVGETENPDHDSRTIALLVDDGDVVNEGELEFWRDNVVDE